MQKLSKVVISFACPKNEDNIRCINQVLMTRLFKAATAYFNFDYSISYNAIITFYFEGLIEIEKAEIIMQDFYDLTKVDNSINVLPK